MLNNDNLEKDCEKALKEIGEFSDFEKCNEENIETSVQLERRILEPE